MHIAFRNRTAANVSAKQHTTIDIDDIYFYHNFTHSMTHLITSSLTSLVKFFLLFQPKLVLCDYY